MQLTNFSYSDRIDTKSKFSPGCISTSTFSEPRLINSANLSLVSSRLENAFLYRLKAKLGTSEKLILSNSRADIRFSIVVFTNRDLFETDTDPRVDKTRTLAEISKSTPTLILHAVLI
jgi:hypothetical protein